MHLPILAPLLTTVVMRACEGCRRRKIKCDAATTNTWPCAACVRLKLPCSPPTMGFDGNDAVTDADFAHDNTINNAFSFDDVNSFLDSNNNNNNNYQYSQSDMQQQYFPVPQANQYQHMANPADQSRSSSFASAQPAFDATFQYASLDVQAPTAAEAAYAFSTSFSDSSRHSDRTIVKGHTPEVDEPDLSEALKDLKISKTGLGNVGCACLEALLAHGSILAPYMTNNKTLADAPAIQEHEYILPIELNSSSHATIPVEMMPPDHVAMHYFQYYFDNIHPFVPVLNSTYFYKQWRTNRQQISPLILEGIFACSTQTMQTSIAGSQWLALASR